MGAMKTAIFCITCNKELQNAIYDSAFFPNLITVMTPFIAITLLVFLLAGISARKGKKNTAAGQQLSFITACIVTGIGLGGFIDGIFLHQILQWHEMLSNKLPPVTLTAKSVNMFWDGIFHLFTLIATVTGIVLLWRAMAKGGRYPGRRIAGGLLFGWALFNILEGVIDHHILKLHNVRDVAAHPEIWNYAFDGFSVLLGLGGYLLIKSGQRLLYPGTKPTVD